MKIISEEAKDTITEIFNTGIGMAASALSELLTTEIYLTVPVLEILSYDDMMRYLIKDKYQEFVVIHEAFSGGLVGKGIVSFPVINGKTLVNLLLDAPGNSEESLNVLELEAISEVGNLLINAIGSTIADMIEAEIRFSLPNTSITRQIIDIDEEKPENTYILGQTNFSVKNRKIEGNIIFVFSYGDIEKMINKFR